MNLRMPPQSLLSDESSSMFFDLGTPSSLVRHNPYRCLRIHHTGAPYLANMGEKEDNGGNAGGPGSILSDLLAEGIKGFFWGPHGIQIGIGLTIIVVSKLMGYW